MQLDICEIFYSLQGESTFTGLPCVFIRLSGCNLNCSWCDTHYAREESRVMTFDQIFKKLKSYPCHLVEITGGEPLLQDNTPALISMLIKKGYQVLVETNGSKSINNLPPECIKIMDIKCPSSNESDSFLSENILFLSQQDEVKFVIGSKEDYIFAKSIIENDLGFIPQKNIHLSPVFGCISPETIANWILGDHLPARLSLQQHKIIWNPEKRGV
ncbi:MAG: radical SAM protein [Desulfobacula sp.]|nr:radical SAM protein [Desulfobacula sp.]